MPPSGFLKSPASKVILFLLCLIPMMVLVTQSIVGNLGANPVETITHESGEWALRFLLITLAISPLMKWFKKPQLARFRRMLGLYAFFYACCHFLIWFVADHALDFDGMLEDIIKRPYITVGFSAFVLLIPLALTSNRAMLIRLGKAWKKLHRLTYVIVLLGVLHFLWLVKADYLEPGIYAAIALALLLQRVNFSRWLSSKSATNKPATKSTAQSSKLAQSKGSLLSFSTDERE